METTNSSLNTRMSSCTNSIKCGIEEFYAIWRRLCEREALLQLIESLPFFKFYCCRKNLIFKTLKPCAFWEGRSFHVTFMSAALRSIDDRHFKEEITNRGLLKMEREERVTEMMIVRTVY